MQHELQYIKRGRARTPYCVCGWIGTRCAYEFEAPNIRAAQDQFVEHLLGLDSAFETKEGETNA